MIMKEIFEFQLQQFVVDMQHTTFLLAVSGGVDSMVLLDLFQKLGLKFQVAHCNFQLRGEESEDETQFLNEFCQKRQIILHIKYFDTKNYAVQYKQSIQMAARELRYAWFQELLIENQLDYLVTAHHLNDQIETYFINSLRATGTKGLIGIPAKNEQIIRPLLSFSRTEIEQYATDNQLEWKEDSSNQSTKYIRNKIRKEIIPILEEISPDLYQNFQQLFSNVKEDYLLKDEFLTQIKQRFTRKEQDVLIIDFEKLFQEENGFIKLKQILLPYGFSDENELEKMLQSISGKYIQNADYQLLKNRGELHLREINLNFNKELHFFIKKNEQEENITLIFENFFLKNRADFQFVAEFDAENIQFPLHIRVPKEGELFQPLGMNGRKKISKYLKDKKLSIFEKEAVRVLVDAKDEILWVIGFQIDNRFKLNKNTTKILKITVQ